MKKIILFAFILCFSTGFSQSEEVNGWPIFARVKFVSKLFKEQNAYFLAPEFDQSVKALVGSEITIKGYYIPFDLPKNRMVISKMPYAECFFCGGAGPESVAEAVLINKVPKMKVDQRITIKGKLKLNDTDINHMNFILIDAELTLN